MSTHSSLGIFFSLFAANHSRAPRSRPAPRLFATFLATLKLHLPHFHTLTMSTKRKLSEVQAATMHHEDIRIGRDAVLVDRGIVGGVQQAVDHVHCCCSSRA
jgi:hypothetical protein